jgi:hypothetical protein
MGELLPTYFYGDPADVLERQQRFDVYRDKRCLGCSNWDVTREQDPCRLRLRPGKNWCKGFDEQ